MMNLAHYSISAFQARSLDIVTQVVEPFEDFLAVERVAKRMEVFRDGENFGPSLGFVNLPM